MSESIGEILGNILGIVICFGSFGYFVFWLVEKVFGPDDDGSAGKSFTLHAIDPEGVTEFLQSHPTAILASTWSEVGKGKNLNRFGQQSVVAALQFKMLHPNHTCFIIIVEEP